MIWKNRLRFLPFSWGRYGGLPPLRGVAEARRAGARGETSPLYLFGKEEETKIVLGIHVVALYVV
jgi:hypothetical protein